MKSQATANKCVPEDYKDRTDVRITSIPIKWRGMFRKVYDNDCGRALRIKTKCLDCCCYQMDMIATCDAVTCPLWAIRPYQQRNGRKESQ